MQQKCIILGAGMTGLAAGWASGLPVYEAEKSPGGICSSYYVRPGNQKRLAQAPADGEVYRFEIGGGHWIFGGEPAVLQFIGSLTPVKSYSRKSAVFFPQDNLYVPYPLQNHLSHLDREVAESALAELKKPSGEDSNTMAEWLEKTFGATLTQLFFAPFHELYTAGLWRHIAPQDAYKSPIDLSQVVNGMIKRAKPVGYNVNFIYPREGLDGFARGLTIDSTAHYGKQATHIDVSAKMVYFQDGSNVKYSSLISTLPLNKMMTIAGLQIDAEPDPFTSMLVLNIGARQGSRCPEQQWLYIPQSEAGFHRVGFYSNVDVSFLPESSQRQNDRVSIYVERAYAFGQKPAQPEMDEYAAAVIKELQKWGFIAEPEVVDPTWIEVAYTWSRPGSRWRETALKCLEEHDIFMTGRYGRWKFQGIADSITEGLIIGKAFKDQNGHGRGAAARIVKEEALSK